MYIYKKNYLANNLYLLLAIQLFSFVCMYVCECVCERYTYVFVYV